ncbi:glycoside hydrolase family 18 protein [Fimbriiglobus ruber]|uniref:chitinase n=1 Tax=Fimbriiglobus ruber TaxID=1908690 RepID=A0A225DYN0_9BACT|nr:glycoside hydrolase family 18 protein [Fimbriiglobus ruber]OWK46432.1 Chitinase [Fimbriiglobus ruber]
MQVPVSVSLIVGLCLLGRPTMALRAAEPPAKEREPSPFRVVGYVPDYRVASYDADAAKYLTDLIYFAAEPSPSGEAGLERIKPATLNFLKQIKEKHGVRVHICLGGWNRSKNFAELAASADARKKLAGQVTQFCLTNGFDGVDVDWEHPTKARELKDHALLLGDMKKAFEPHKLRLSVAMAGWQEISPEAIAAVDAVHLMAYDGKGRHSTFEFADAEITRVAKKNVPLEKICLGVPFYGRAVAKHDTALTYGQIVKKSHPAPEVNEVDGVYFNGPKTIERKTMLALEKKLGGVMIWELGQDAAGESEKLLPVIRRAIDASRQKR